jgi:hypothetical protein
MNVQPTRPEHVSVRVGSYRTCPRCTRGHIDPAFSPDGTELAFARNPGDGGGLDVATAMLSNFAVNPITAGTPTEITPDATGQRIRDEMPEWAPTFNDPVVSEAPLSVVLPISGVALGLAGLTFSRRRQASGVV